MSCGRQHPRGSSSVRRIDSGQDDPDEGGQDEPATDADERDDDQNRLARSLQQHPRARYHRSRGEDPHAVRRDEPAPGQ